MDVYEAIRERRSIRFFKQNSLPRDAIQTILDAARWAPTGCNKQLFEIIVLEAPKLRRQVAKLSNRQPYFHQAPVVLLVLYDTSKELVPHGVGPDIPAINTGALLQNMLLQAHALGIGSLVVGAITKKKELRKLLKIPDCYEPMCFVLLGYPDETPLAPPRRDIDDFVHLNKFGNLQSGKRRRGALYPNSVDPEKWRWEEFIEFKTRILYFGGSTGKCEPTGITSLTASLLDVVSMRLRSHNATKILDLFPNNGLFLRPLAWRIPPADGTQLSAVEFSGGTAKHIEHILRDDGLKIHAEALKLGQSDEVVFPFAEETFDAATCLFRLENLPNRLRILRESWKVLKKDGVMLISFFSKFGPYDLTRRLISLSKPNDFNKRWHWSFGPWHALSKRSVTKDLARAEFATMYEYHFYDLPSILKSLVAGLASLVGVSTPFKRSTYGAPVKASGFLPSVILLEALKKGV